MHVLALVLLAVVLLRLALGLLSLVCHAAVWLLVRLCWLVEAGVDRLRQADKTRPRTVLEPTETPIVFKRARARVQPRPDRSIEHPGQDPADVELAQLVTRVVGRRDPATRALTERMLRDATPMEVH